MTPDQRPRLTVLGLDGLPLSLAREWCRRGLTPNLARIALSGSARSMRAELPELSPVNWTSFATAAGPEEHGVFGFTRIDPRSYDVAIVDSTAVRCPTLFQRLGARGLTSKVINLPNTYPAQPLKGMLVAGFVAPELSRAVYPPFLSGPLTQAGYKLEADTARGKDDPELLLAQLNTTLDSRRAALDLLWPDLAWDLFVFVLTETDRLFHFHYPALSNPDHPLAPACEGFIRRWDMLIGDFLDRFEALPGPKRLLALADHGFTELITEVDLNAWLVQQGLTRLTGTHEHENDARAVASDSQALALDPGRIYLHTRERFARGGVTPTQAPGLLARIREGLLNLRFEGRPVIREVHQRQTLYPGPMAPVAPDLVAEPHPGFSLTAKFDARELFGFHGRRGVHTVGDVFFYDSEGAAPQRLRDTGRLVLDFFGIPKQD
ncbi:MAG: alkaline phosphatase family protein [Proteobacteria bacterium]|nr:alkaline phosphatase family protein [Pseudomonadota bacterium]